MALDITLAPPPTGELERMLQRAEDAMAAVGCDVAATDIVKALCFAAATVGHLHGLSAMRILGILAGAIARIKGADPKGEITLQ